MALPVTIPNTFANATAAIPLSQLDANFNTLSNAVNGLNSGSETLANLKATTANVVTLTVTGNATIGDASTDTVTLNSTLTANTAVIFSAGTSAAPSITFTGDTNTGIFSPAADTIAFTEGGAEAARFNSSGFLGLGYTDPRGRLYVGTADLSSGSTDASNGINLKQTSTTAATGIYLERSGERKGYYIYVGGDADSLTFQRNNNGTKADTMSLDRDGNVGIGVTPSAWSTANSVRAVQLNSGSFWTYSNSAIFLSQGLYFNGTNRIYTITGEAIAEYGINSGVHIWSTASSGTSGNTATLTERARITAAGELCVGTTAAATTATLLTLNNPASADCQFYLQNTTTGTGNNGFRILMSGNNATITNKESGYIAFETSDTERARITSGGEFLVGTTTATHSGVTSKCILKSANDVLGLVTDSGNTQAVRFTNGTTAVGSINLTTTTTAYATSSDYRLKENILPMTGALATVQQLNPVTYNWRADGSAGQGFIAHEIQEVCPDAVTGEKDGEQMQGVDYGKLTPILTAALQEAIAKIETLEARISALEAK